MKWRYRYDDAEWTDEPLPRRDHCKYCHGERNVWYMHDDMLHHRHDSEFNIMQVCGICEYHLNIMRVKLSEQEMTLIREQGRPTKRHVHASVYYRGKTQDIVNNVPVIPYEFVGGKP